MNVTIEADSRSAMDRDAVRRPGYRAGIVGAGFMGRVHARAIRAAGGAVVAAVGRDAERSAAAAAELGADGTHADLAALLADAEIEVVHVCTPNASHLEIATAALEAGKDVVCEKPLALDVAAATGLVRLAQESGRLLAVPYVYRFHPMVREARARIARGEIGRPLVAHGGYLQDWLLSAEQTDWRADSGEGGRSRAFADIGSHWCDLFEFVVGERISAISAVTHRAHSSRAGVEVSNEDIVLLQLRTEAGTLGSAVISQVSAGRKNKLTLEIGGTAGSVFFDQENPETLWLGRRSESTLLVRDPETLSAESAPYAVVPAGHPQGYQECFTAFVSDVARSRSGQIVPGLPTGRDGARSIRLVQAVLASEGSWIDVP